MQVSREIDYGMRAMVILAANEREILSKRRISQGFEIPINFLAIILPNLVHKGLIESLPGPRGGYRLAKLSNDISMRDVICAVDPNFGLTRCIKDKKQCDQSSICPITELWQKLQDDVDLYLSKISIASIAKELGVRLKASGGN